MLFSSHFAGHVDFVEMSMLITLSCYFHNYTCILLHSHVFISVLLCGASCRCTYDLILMAHFGLIYVLGKEAGIQKLDQSCSNSVKVPQQASKFGFIGDHGKF
ncbi:hypothetical protein CISIN_1g044712mg [Citrus sinensis]|uniref:Uncharacterized protein n=1 Tax=Citrus sinensis TaxID=2711 RepID=A0A067EJM6_CITSI|nr:hypothetical protein CISIN_1g044712mg [Citrus sinensis]